VRLFEILPKHQLRLHFGLVRQRGIEIERGFRFQRLLGDPESGRRPFASFSAKARASGST
jgi:hypothetical protein